MTKCKIQRTPKEERDRLKAIKKDEELKKDKPLIGIADFTPENIKAGLIHKIFNHEVLLTSQAKRLIFKQFKMDCRCPLKLKTAPTKACPSAQNELFKEGTQKQRCEWYIHHPNSNYCFWSFMALFGDSKLTLEEQANLLNTTITSIVLTERDGLKKIKKKYPTVEDFVRPKDFTV